MLRCSIFYNPQNMHPNKSPRGCRQMCGRALWERLKFSDAEKPGGCTQHNNNQSCFLSVLWPIQNVEEHVTRIANTYHPSDETICTMRRQTHKLSVNDIFKIIGPHFNASGRGTPNDIVPHFVRSRWRHTFCPLGVCLRHRRHGLQPCILPLNYQAICVKAIKWPLTF